MGLDLGIGDSPVPPLTDKPRGEEVDVKAQVEFQRLSFVMQFIESKKLVLGGKRPSVKGSVGQIVGQKGSALVNLDWMNDVAAGGPQSRLCKKRVPVVSFTINLSSYCLSWLLNSQDSSLGQLPRCVLDLVAVPTASSQYLQSTCIVWAASPHLCPLAAHPHLLPRATACS